MIHERLIASQQNGRFHPGCDLDQVLNAGANRSSDTAFPIRIGNDRRAGFLQFRADGFNKIDFMFSRLPSR